LSQNTQCNTCTSCNSTFYQTIACQAGGIVTQNRVCSACSTCTQYENQTKACQQGGDVTQNTVCVPNPNSCNSLFGYAIVNNTCKKLTCVACPAGSVSISNSTCSTCGPGYYAFNNNCVVCEANFFCVNGIKTPCTPPGYSSTGQSYCLMCQAGTYANGSVCVICPKGYYCTNGTNLIPCIPGK
jgi:hypothetical protein